MGPVNSFLMPDISGGGTTSQPILAAARALADSMTGTEVILRAAAEIGGTWLLAWMIKAAIARLGAAALQVSAHLLPRWAPIAAPAPRVPCMFTSSVVPFTGALAYPAALGSVCSAASMRLMHAWGSNDASKGSMLRELRSCANIAECSQGPGCSHRGQQRQHPQKPGTDLG